jgi:hypothetical protein
MIDRDCAPGRFQALYEEWVSAYPNPRDPAIAQRLAAMCRDAWATVDPNEQLSVLSFVFVRKDPANADLIVEGMRSAHARVVSHASACACSAHGLHYLDFGPGFRKVWRDLARRFPGNDTFRPREFYGHEPGDDDDWAEHPFLNLYEDWRAAEFPGDPALLQRLTDTYREAWTNGDAIERAFVLHFVSVNFGGRKPLGALDGTDLLIEALETRDLALALTAVHKADLALSQGEHPGPRRRELLKGLRERFPDTFITVGGALLTLDKLKGKRS